MDIIHWIIAQNNIPTEWWQSLLQGGSAAAVSSAMVVWFALRMEKLLERLREAMERNTNSLMISVLNTKHLDEALRPLAERIERDSAEALKK
jgi:hypothetical protein